MQPRSIGQAGHIGGVNPADISALLVHLEVSRRRAEAAEAGAAEPADAAAGGGRGRAKAEEGAVGAKR